jgi:hypothetical protein
MLTVLVAIARLPVVVADVQRMFAAFSITPPRSAEMNVRAVDLKRAMRDMPFTVVVPPPFGGLPIASIDEIVHDGPKGDRSLIFELRKSTSGPEILVVESKASSPHVPALFTIGDPADPSAIAPNLPNLPIAREPSRLPIAREPSRLPIAREPSRLPAAQGLPRLPAAHEHNGLLLERDTSSDAPRVAPGPWTVGGTRIEILSPPGFLSPKALNEIRRAFLKTR